MTVASISRPACHTPDGYEPPLASNWAGYWLPPFDDVYQLADGVDGWAVERDGRVEIRVIMAHHPGNGDVMRLIDSLSPRCTFSCVVSVQLANMLQKRGWWCVIDSYGTDIWIHPNGQRVR